MKCDLEVTKLWMKGGRFVHVLPFSVFEWIFVDRMFDQIVVQCTQLSPSIAGLDHL